MPEQKQILNDEEEDFQNLKDREQQLARRQFNKVRMGQGGPQAHPAIASCSCNDCRAAFPEGEEKKRGPGRPAKVD